jgi:hypothetical protein
VNTIETTMPYMHVAKAEPPQPIATLNPVLVEAQRSEAAKLRETAK